MDMDTESGAAATNVAQAGDNDMEDDNGVVGKRSKGEDGSVVIKNGNNPAAHENMKHRHDLNLPIPNARGNIMILSSAATKQLGLGTSVQRSFRYHELIRYLIKFLFSPICRHY